MAGYVPHPSDISLPPTQSVQLAIPEVEPSLHLKEESRGGK